MFGLGGAEIGLIFLIVLLIFGPSQIPKMARGLGQALREFRKAQREITDEVNREDPPAEKSDKPGPTSGSGTGTS
ncbi:MAG: twin-arginine translocase TatA/TatE family subunit [Candidatus Eisenbacteria bacterium]|uniref:Sec-independent protein translocase protein TatA n=1 Tax=Eiseniibacteriota bacterium TaxID=2212470 RepID=A0A538UCE7_UNCEI|nr:MAG: twin-arginine translocase TatA/TatE family subunit [Candidatus Eisenbacteria bacterium]